MRIHIKHVGEDYAGVAFSFGPLRVKKGITYENRKKYAEVSLSDLKILKALEVIAKAVLDKYPDNDDID